ncbi:MAG: TonB-dependent receptor [Caulobacteraceae bacterium]|nr:TonB-dependent receptor [Caulobacteraceae bacterium]
MLLYAKYSEGYQAPGFNGFPGRLVPPNTFYAENLDAFELGIKSQFFDRALTFNAAAFHYEYSDLQVRGTPGPGLTDIRNAAGATIDGVEASVVLRANEYLSFTGNLTYLDARYDEFCELIGGGSPVGADPLCDATHADRSGNRLSLAPEWTGGVNANLEVPMGSITLRGNLGYSFETNSFFTSVNEDVLSTGGWERIDARLGVGFADGLEVYAFGRNLSDDRYTGYGLRALPNLAPVTFNDPRTYGVGIRYHF